MRRILLIAKRDYLQMVRSKAYLVGLDFSSAALRRWIPGCCPLPTGAKRRNQRVAVIDRTGVSAAAVIQAAEEANRKAMANAPFGARACRTTSSKK